MSKISAIQKGISYLLWKTPKGKVDPKTLGYVLPNGNINFQSKETAYNYAKNYITKALNDTNPYERGVVIEGNRIVGQVEGSPKNVSTKGLNFSTDSSMLHGHPTLKTERHSSITTPISFGDYINLNEHGNGIIAFNSLGEFSKLSKKPNFKPLNKEQLIYYKKIHDTYMAYENDFMSKIKPRLPFEFKDCKNIQEIKLKIKELEKFGYGQKEIKYLKYRSNQVVRDMLGLDEVKGIHKFWQDYADELGVVYKTNYSYL